MSLPCGWNNAGPKILPVYMDQVYSASAGAAQEIQDKLECRMLRDVATARPVVASWVLFRVPPRLK